MEKQKRWQLYLILAVIVLTLYNIMPTVFYYTKPLRSQIDSQRAHEVSVQIADRVNKLEDEAKAWLGSFTKLLGIKPESIELKKNDPRLVEITFKNSQDASLFKRFFSKAGSLIPFVPAQMELYAGAEEEPNKVLVSRQIGVHLDDADLDKLFHFAKKYDEEGAPTQAYRDMVYDRAATVALGFAGTSENAAQVEALAQNPTDPRYDDLVISLATRIVEADKVLGSDSALLSRWFASFTQTNAKDPAAYLQKYLTRAETLKTKIVADREVLLKELEENLQNGEIADLNKEQTAAMLDNQRQVLENSSAIIRKNLTAFSAGKKPLTVEEIRQALKKGESAGSWQDKTQIVSLEGRNPFVESLAINWSNDKISLNFYPDLAVLRNAETVSEGETFRKEKIGSFVINEVARISRLSDETIQPDQETFAINLNNLTNTQSFLSFDLGYLAQKQSQQILQQIENGWQPQHADLSRLVYPIRDFDAFKKEASEDQKLGLVIYAPARSKETPPAGFRTGSIYVIAKGMETIGQKYKAAPNSPESAQLTDDINKLGSILQQNGFIGYRGSSYGMAPEFSKDYIYELDDYYSNLLKATREDFTVKGSKRAAVLDFSDVEQRLITLNRIDDRIQEDLLKWKEEYSAAQVDLNVTSHYQVPAPTQNVYWENFKLSFVKYFRGDDRKVLKWGLDLSGGKTVRIGLRDHNNRVVTNPEDLNQAVNELYTRINKMGVSERTIRIDGNNIILDFPGSQGLSATDLVKASAMYFHIVNEKFSVNNPTLRESVNQFLQNVWNEAVVTNRKDAESVNEIAWQQLGADNMEQVETRPRSEHARILWENGLRLANPKEAAASASFNDTISTIGILRGSDFSEWDGQSHPLIVMFHNFALEGSSLENVQVGYDPSQGNILNFGIKRSYEGSDRTGSPRDDFYAWTSQFAQDKIAGTPKAAFGKDGWRMAVVLNGTIITHPVLRAALRDGATISGRFSQREINQLAADLKAGSLSFTPRILSEENVSPDLGKEERTRGIVACAVALLLVIAAMVGYYHFAGVVASCAVILNILIMWGVLQNLDAALTLPGLAGIVLTIGMAVDANVLVFERIREEFKISGRIASAIQAGYRKAFSAIVDSNITTIIAALILIQFDSGPIKSFAVTLIVGIVSSMFTALFVTRYFFAGWAQNPKNKSLSMSQFFGQTNFDFLAQTRKAVTISLVVMAVGIMLFISQSRTMFGMDFTGGYSLNVELQEKPGHPSYRLEAEQALKDAGATTNDVQIRELSKPNQLRIQLSMSMEEKDHPFYHMPEIVTEGKYTYPWQSNPRLVWVASALEKGGLSIESSQLENLDKNWTVMSGQFSDAMRYNAIIGLALALFCILVYITFRFEFKYAVGAVIGLAHDVVITLGILALFHKMGLPVQIDLQVVGAIMTIVGYSLNDTIIVFDRIREDIRVLRKLPFNQVVNHALNVTLSRTIMTSGTTLLVLLALVFIGGNSIFAFSLVMTIGVIVGTLSSLFIASPVMIYIHNREEQKLHESAHLRKI